MSSHARHVPASRKRKELDGGSNAPLAGIPKPSSAPPPGQSGNLLLAGYLAHEFLTRGTVLGQKWGPARSADPAWKTEPASAYADVAMLVKGDGAHIPGVVNPTQLARWLQS